MNLNIEKETYQKSASMIERDTSPVGIDAKKTHIIILKLLSDILEKLDRIEQKISS